MGWDTYREQTFARQKQLGIVPQDAALTTRPASLPAWDSLSADQKRLFERMMEVFAAYGYQVDQGVGRILDHVARLPDADNTLILYIIGDNGASAEGGFDGIEVHAYGNSSGDHELLAMSSPAWWLGSDKKRPAGAAAFRPGTLRV